MCLKNTFPYIKLCYRLFSYYKYYLNTNDHNITLLNSIVGSINECGAVMIKFCQWVTPKLELIYLENDKIINEEKPEWLTILEQFYENCKDHDLEYTKNQYEKVFNEKIDNIYDIGEIIGSGSIGQVYLLTNKETNEKEVMKILHPNVSNEINYFRKFMKFLLFFPCIKKKIMQLFPFDIFEFIHQFNEQTDFTTEANHLLYFYNEYKDNQFIVIPRLIKCSSSILIMTYENGVSLDNSELNDYEKDKIVNLYHLFVRNNQMLRNYNHGDLHPGNWKIDQKNKIQKLIIYDFGYCWRIPRLLFEDIGTIFFDTFEESSNDDVGSSQDNLCKLMYISILYDKPDKEMGYKQRISDHINKTIKSNGTSELTVIDSLKATISFCIDENVLLDPKLIQCYIVFIQGQKLFEKYNLMSSSTNIISDYEVYRDKYLNILTFCKTYDIFPEHSVYIENKLNSKQVKIENIFDTIEMDDSIKELLIPK